MEKEEKYFNIMSANSGVLYLMGRPGEAKTAMIENIAKTRGFQFIDLRLSQMDETDIGLFPFIENGVVRHAIPEWADRANKEPTIIMFDELNRSRESIRNAALQILNERRIGYGFKFNENVHFVAAGNLGEEDGTSVDEFDTALWNRLIPIKHFLTIEEWVDGFAEENVWNYIVSFVNSHPDHFYREPGGESKQFATPRSWTFLSNHLETRFQGLENIKLEEAKQIVKEIGWSFVGNSATTFIRYLEDMSSINVNDIIERFDQVSSQVKKMSRAQISEMIHALKDMNTEKFKTNEINNITEFLKLVHIDERVSYLLDVISSMEDIKKNSKSKKLIDNFSEDIMNIKKNMGL
jgi:hypothetical protein